MDSAQYDAWYDTERGRWIGDQEYALIHKRLRPRPGEHLLDVGCGSGWFTQKFAAMTGVSVMGVDIDDEALAFARARDSLSTYIAADACQLPFLDNEFDRAVSITAFGFVDSWQKALSEIIRVARSRFVIGLLNRNSLLWYTKGQNGGTGAYRGAYWHTAQELRAELGKHPVHNIRIDSAIFMASGSGLARITERIIPSSLPFGSFLLISGDRLSR